MVVCFFCMTLNQNFEYFFPSNFQKKKAQTFQAHIKISTSMTMIERITGRIGSAASITSKTVIICLFWNSMCNFWFVKHEFICDWSWVFKKAFFAIILIKIMRFFDRNAKKNMKKCEPMLGSGHPCLWKNSVNPGAPHPSQFTLTGPFIFA